MQKPTLSRTQSGSLVDTYYIYSYDGKLLAEYDHNGNCVRDYIYSENRLIAEYRPQTNAYYYYMSDQVNTTRIITDGNGNVVYSAIHSPYGEVQKTWTDNYDAKLKFSGKEREGYSELDYFGARYYDHSSCRFISVDPIINKTEALFTPQLWNLYSYCRNNPVTFIDPTGLDNYVFYDPDSFSTQARVEAKRLKELNSEDTHLYAIRSEKQFVKKWNSMKDPTNVTLLFHSTAGETAPRTISIDWMRDEFLTTNPTGYITKTAKGTPINKLAKHSIGTLRLYICHSAETQDNIAIAFFNTQNIKTVIGVNGPFNYQWFTYTPRMSNDLVYFIRRIINIKLVDKVK